ncbi:hypothetical protein HPP92_015319 [Vanilla planifolia]|uniref:BHLH domain-containing protein n=1 Tax=Vanilla planifolia TaxID=51239 RepID=A0A835QRA5_VANPL|nr:hypothetical protein HPP92_015319 [Vanilla planifolia]
MDWREKEKLIASSSNPSVSMEESFSHVPWHHPSNAHASSLLELQKAASSSTVGKQAPLGWNSSDHSTKAGNLLASGEGILPLGLSHFPSAARCSFFDETVNPFVVPNTLAAIDGKIEAFGDGSATVDRGSPLKEIKEVSEEINGEARDELPNSSQVGFDSRKRKRCNQNDVSVNHHKAEQNTSKTAVAKQAGKNSTVGGEAPKEEYIHVRARRGQATNSHSLAERLRREKISERMKLLQGLVPGCSKLSGKAVMLDEIINYVQSLQRQVEFLSMKLAAFNPTEVILHQGSIQHSMAGIINPPSEALTRTGKAQLPSSKRLPIAWEEGLHKVVQMINGDENPVLEWISS